ncbi:MAG: nitroreductase family protein [Candidatus Liptonbacteria bacterium]|nr:nitroreductase family protein [Candidatus Liptonbacteria bacterium]
MDENIKKILWAGVQAPSGDNSQPWKFKVKDNAILILNLPEKDNPIFNFRGRGTLVAHGALIENMVIAASSLGYRSKVDVFPDKEDPGVTAKVIFEKDYPRHEQLYGAISERATNRKVYMDKSFTPQQRNRITGSVKGEGKLILIEDALKKAIIGKATAVNEIVMLENRQLHDYFFGDIRWTSKDELEKKSGLYLETMELTPPQKAVFKVLSYWPAARALNSLGIAKFIARENSKVYSSGSAMGAITVPDNDEAFVGVGRLMERIWLEATDMNLSMHLITGVIYLMQGILGGESRYFSDKHISIIKEAYEDIRTALGVENETIAMLFRIGYGDKPSARSSRLEPVILN